MSQRNTGAPSRAVRIPTGISLPGRMERHSTSAHRRNTPPPQCGQGNEPAVVAAKEQPQHMGHHQPYKADNPRVVDPKAHHQGADQQIDNAQSI